MSVHPTRIAGAAALTLGLLGAAAGVAGAESDHAPGESHHALFVQTDASSGNTILSFARQADGTLPAAGSTASGGLGGTAVGATADPLASQGGLVLADHGHVLLSVNAGSDSVSAFRVEGTELRLTQTIASGGSFPVSIAVRGERVVVLNAGGAGAVAEFRLDDGRLHALASDVRSLGLANTNPPFFVAGPGQVGFTPDGTHLVVTTKHAADAIDTFSVGHHGDLGAAPVVTSSQTPVPFSFSFDAAGRLVVTEALLSHVSTYQVNADGTLSPLGTVADSGAALCWITQIGGVYYGSNAGSSDLSSFTLNSAGQPVLDQAVAAVAHKGTTDSVASPDGSVLYVESGGSGALDAYQVNGDGTLTPIQTLLGLPVGIEGLAAS